MPGQYEIKFNGGLEVLRYQYRDYTDLRDGGAYSLTATNLQLYVTASY